MFSSAVKQPELYILHPTYSFYKIVDKSLLQSWKVRHPPV